MPGYNASACVRCDTNSPSHMCLGRTSTLQMLCHRHPHLSLHHLMISIDIMWTILSIWSQGVSLSLTNVSGKSQHCKTEMRQYCLNGWPETWKLKGLVKLYRQVSSEIAIQDGLLMRNNRIIIPSLLRQEILDKVHTGH